MSMNSYTSVSAMPRPSQRVLFIGGLHRSGTTHLAELISQHPDTSAMSNTGAIMNEGQYLQDQYPQDWQFGGPGRFAYQSGAHRIEEREPARRAAISAELLRQWAPHWDLSRNVLIEKTPGNCLMSRYLQSCFENAHFVFIVRHPVAVALATRKWSRTSLFSLIDHWLVAHRLMREDASHLRNVLWVSYEELVADPSAVVARVQGFAGLQPTPLRLSTTSNHNLAYFDTWRSRYLGDLDLLGARPDQRPARAPLPLLQRSIWSIRAFCRRAG